MEYPKLKPELDRRRKLMPEDIENIRSRYERGESIAFLAKCFEVCKSTILYWVDENYRLNMLKRTAKHNAEYKKRNPDKHRQSCKQTMRYIAKVNPLYNEYAMIISHEYYVKNKDACIKRCMTYNKNNRNKLKVYYAKYYEKNREQILNKKREWYQQKKLSTT